MNFLRSMFAAFTMYSKFPAPRVEWTKDTMAWALWFFPLVGVAIGAVLWLWLVLCELLELSVFLSSAGALVIPMLLSGGIHMDGFCDTADALASNLDRERKLEILKDTHTGAFAIICCCMYFVVFFAAWCGIRLTRETIMVLCAGPVLSRSLSGMAAVTLPNARGSGLLASFTESVNLRSARIIMVIWIAAASSFMLYTRFIYGAFYSYAVYTRLIYGAVSIAAAAATYVYYVIMSKRKFGGITGDLAGYFLQMCELAMVIAVSVTQNIITGVW